jgi:hypothetical protein
MWKRGWGDYSEAPVEKVSPIEVEPVARSDSMSISGAALETWGIEAVGFTISRSEKREVEKAVPTTKRKIEKTMMVETTTVKYRTVSRRVGQTT